MNEALAGVRRWFVVAAVLTGTFLVPAVADAALRKQVNVASTTIRRQPSSYVIGNAYNGWTVDVQGPTDGGYRWGYIYGNFNGCAWIYEGSIPAGGTTVPDKCPPPTYYPTSYFTDGEIGSNSSGNDGAPATLDYSHTNCTDHNSYGNVRPWLVPAEAHDAFGTFPDLLSVKWRYVTNDGNWVMIHDTRYDPAGGFPPNWYFVRRNCIYLN